MFNLAYKYIDPGFGFSSYDNSEFGFVKGAIHIENYAYNRNFGVAFYTDDLSTIRFSDSANSNNFYLKFDEFFPASVNYAQFYFFNGDFRILRILQQGTNTSIFVADDTELTLSTASGDLTHIETGRINTIWLHVEADGQKGRITLMINGNYVFHNQEVWGFTGPVTSTFHFSIDENLPVSNFILSDEEIHTNETIIEIDSSAVETTMLVDSDTYSSAGIGDYVLQILDPSSLYNQFHSETKVSAMVAVASHAYSTGDAVKTLTCRVVDGNTVNDYKIRDVEGSLIALPLMTKIDFQNLVDNQPLIAKQIPVTSDTTFANLDGLKVGWLTGI